MVVVRRGEVVLARLDPTLGVEIKKTRPVIVLSNDSINQFAELAVVVPLTKNTARVSPSHAVIPKGAAGLAFPCKAVTEQIRAVDKRRLVRRLGRLGARSARPGRAGPQEHLRPPVDAGGVTRAPGRSMPFRASAAS